MKNITKTITTALLMSTLTASYAKASINPTGDLYEEHPCFAFAATTASAFLTVRPDVIANLGRGPATLGFLFAVAGMPLFAFKCIASSVNLPFETPVAVTAATETPPPPGDKLLPGGWAPPGRQPPPPRPPLPPRH